MSEVNSISQGVFFQNLNLVGCNCRTSVVRQVPRDDYVGSCHSSSGCGWLSWDPIEQTLGVGDAWRIGPDALSWENVLMNIDAAASAAPWAGRGAFPDVDEVMGPSRGRPINAARTRTQLSFIALVGSPLLISYDLSALAEDDPDVAPLLNDELLAVHADNVAPAGGAPLFGRVLGGGVGADKQPPLTRLKCDPADPAVQWRFMPVDAGSARSSASAAATSTSTPTSTAAAGYFASVGAPGSCLQAGPSWFGTFNNAQVVWVGACGGDMCGDARCLNQVFSWDNSTGLLSSLYWPENNIADGPLVSLDAVPNALYLNARFNGSGPLDDAGAQVWDFDFRSGLLRNVADGSCVGAAPREVSANVWFKTLAAGAAPGATALLLINFADAPQTLACDAGCLVRAGLGGRPAGAALAVRDVWARTDNGTVTVGGGFSAVVPGGGASVLVTLTPVGGRGAVVT